jgi:hypothetical protein
MDLGRILGAASSTVAETDVAALIIATLARAGRRGHMFVVHGLVTAGPGALEEVRLDRLRRPADAAVLAALVLTLGARIPKA